MIGSWEPVTHDAYYQAKRDSGLIGRLSEYSSDSDIEATIDYLADIEPEGSLGV